MINISLRVIPASFSLLLALGFFSAPAAADPTVCVISPANGEVVQGTIPTTIRFSVNAYIGPKRFWDVIWVDDGGNENLITTIPNSSSGGEHSVDWTPPNRSSSNARILVRDLTIYMGFRFYDGNDYYGSPFQLKGIALTHAEGNLWLGGSVSWSIEAPEHRFPQDGLFEGWILLSCTGASSNLKIHQAMVNLDFDACTVLSIQNPALFFIGPLDGDGRGATSIFTLPSNPAFSGLSFWAAGMVRDYVSQEFVEGCQTVSFTL